MYVVRRIDAGGPPVGAGRGAGAAGSDGASTLTGSDPTTDLSWLAGIALKINLRSLGVPFDKAAFNCSTGTERSVSMTTAWSAFPGVAAFSFAAKVLPSGSLFGGVFGDILFGGINHSSGSRSHRRPRPAQLHKSDTGEDVGQEKSGNDHPLE